MQVGFIGLGMMGRNAALNVVRRGFTTVVHDIRPDAVAPLIEKGAIAATSPAKVLDQVDVVVTIVFGPKEIEAVVHGDEGILSTNCHDKYWIDLTTSSPQLMRRLGEEFRARGGAPIDAPVTGSVDAAIRGDMPMFVGGDDADIEHVRPVIEAMGEIRKVGKHGNSSTTSSGKSMLRRSARLWSLQNSRVLIPRYGGTS